MKLGHICQTAISGQILPRLEAKTPEECCVVAKAIVPKAIGNLSIREDCLQEVRLKGTVDELRLTKVGDVVVKLSTPYEAAVVREGQEDLVITSFCAVLRGFMSPEMAYFVANYINGPVAQREFRRSTAGSTVPLLRVSALKDLEIPQISLKQQKKFTMAMECNQEQIRILKALLADAEAMKASLLMETLQERES